MKNALRLSFGLVPLVTVGGAPSAGFQSPLSWEKPIAPGLVYRTEIDRQTPRQVHALRLTPGSPSLRWFPQLAGRTIDEEGTFKGRATPTEMAKSEGALAVVNGDFFSFDHGAPIGLTVRGGELLHTPARPRAVFAWGPKASSVGSGDSKASVTIQSGFAGPLDAVNQPISENGFTLYTAAQGTAALREGSVVATLEVPNVVWAPSTTVNATVTAISSGAGPKKVVPGQALLVATGNKRGRVESLRVGQTVTVKLDTPGFDWEKIENVIGGGPMLLKEGKVAINAADEGFNEAFSARRHPRTAIGRTAEGDVWILTIDGRQAHSDGATLDETAAVLRRLGCVDAINLDGGGSTALHVRGLTVNRPSDAKERPVSNAIVIVGPKVPTPVGKLRMVVNPRVMPDGTTQARVDLNGKAVPDIDVLWTARGAAWADPAGRVHFTSAGPATVYARAYGQTVQADLEWSGK